MTISLKHRINWVANDGSYGYGAVLTFDPDDLSERQAETYDNLSDDEKFDYIQALLNGDPTDEWEDQ